MDTIIADNLIDLQEHAILTLRNLLKDNSENQNVVDSIQPSNNWDQRRY